MKAIIPAAGRGTRFLPLTRAVPKEMLPVGAKPALELLVEEAERAGADDVLVVISHEKELVRRYFAGRAGVRFAYQEEQRGLGHAVLQAAEACACGADERVLILLGDALVIGCDAAREMVAASDAHGGAAVIGFERVPRERVSRYGIARPADPAGPFGPGDAFALAGLVEKPAPEAAPSDLAVAGRYLLPGAIFRYLADQTPGVGGEIQLTDAIARMLAERPAFGYVYPGRRQDIGNPEGYFRCLEAFHAHR